MLMSYGKVILNENYNSSLNECIKIAQIDVL